MFEVQKYFGYCDMEPGDYHAWLGLGVQMLGQVGDLSGLLVCSPS